MAALADADVKITNMKLVLLGYRLAGKSSSGNTILGEQEFDTSRKTTTCVRREGDTEHRHITVVEAPGWGVKSTVENTSEHVKKEIVLSVSQCPPGPHALLLAIRLDEPFIETHRKAVEEHMELLGGSVWNHTIVLFTRGDWLGGTSIEQCIENEGETLQWLLEKCGNRYHVLDNKKRLRDQVKELLKKVEKMVERNDGSLFGTPNQQAESREHPPKMSDSGFGSEGVKTESQTPAAKVTQLEKSMRTAFLSKIPFVEAGSIQMKGYIAGGSYGNVYQGSYQGTPAAVKKMAIGECPSDSLEIIIPMHTGFTICEFISINKAIPYRSLFHPHVVKMMAVSKKDNELLIAYEYIHGSNLHRIIHTQCNIKLTEEDKMYIALEIGMAVEYIHGKKVIHQDIKPANILISESTKRAYLTDWGLANMRDSLAQFGVAASRSFFGPRAAGTPLYKAPELLLHNQRCTTMSDMWSVGLTCLEMFTGSEPWNLNNDYALMGVLTKKEPPHNLAKLQPHHAEFVKRMVKYEARSRMNATQMVKCLKSKVDLVKRYGFEF